MAQQELLNFEAEERWLSIGGWPGYDVSDWGRVRSWLTEKVKAFHGGWTFGARPRLLRPIARKSGHQVVYLFRNKKERRCAQVHVLVLEAFVGPCPAGMEACHFPDADPSNNRLPNLRWDTPRENMIDRLRHGTALCLKLKERDIPPIWSRLVAGERSAVIANDYGVTRATIERIKYRTAWVHITQDLPGEPPAKHVPLSLSIEELDALHHRLGSWADVADHVGTTWAAIKSRRDKIHRRQRDRVSA
jgi:hypothetical protein